MSLLRRHWSRVGLSLLLVVAILIGHVRDAAGAVAVSGPFEGPMAADVTSVVWSHQVFSGSDRMLLVRITSVNSNVTVTSVTYGGAAMTLLATATNGSGATAPRATVYYLLAPAVGTANVVAQFSGSVRVGVTSLSFNGVSQTQPFGQPVVATGTSNAPTLTLTGNSGDVFVDAVAVQGTAGTTASMGTGQTGWTGSTGNSTSDVLDLTSHKNGSASSSMSWQYSNSAAWVGIGVAVKAAGAYTVSGRVFEDVNYGGGPGRTLAASGGAGVSGATVELYNSSGTYVSSTTTAAGGTYSFANLAAATYYVRVVSSSVASTRSGSTAALRGVLTFRSNASSGSAVAVTDHVGGTHPALVDPGAASSGAAFNTSTFVYSAGLSGTAQAVSPVAVSSANIGNVDFGFNFDTVVNTRSSGQGSLRQAVINANTLGGDASLAVAGRTAGLEHVVFMIPNGSTGAGGSLGLAAGGLRSSLTAFSAGVASITPGVSLAVSAPLVIDAQAQPGWSANPVVELVGTGAASGSHGLDVGAGPTTVRGLVINRWPASGLNAWAGSGHVIQGNWMGLNNAGTGASANGTEGLNLWSTPNATVGGTTAAARNVLSGNGVNGLVITGPSNGTTVQGNYIGTNAAGTAAVANASLGIYVSAPAIVIGGTATGAGNVISGNTYSGIMLDTGADGTVVQGNMLGTNPAGTAAVPNGGIAVDIYAANNTVGGTTAAGRNLISGNGYAGVYISGAGATGNVIQGNNIGTTASGAAALPNAGEGIVIESAGNTVGGSVAGAGNLISGNTQFGVAVRNSSASNNTIRGNTIGLNAAGNAALSNGSFGIVIDFLAPGTQIIGNVISGNTNAGWSAAQGGIYLYAGATTVRGNTIGMDATGTTAIANGRAVTNSGGIYINGGSTGITIGGTNPGEGNLIAGNIGDGILTDTSAIQASILGNTFGLNTELGIDLRNDGVTANDGVKTTGQPNRRMDHPVFTSATLSGTTLTVAGYVGSAAGQSAFANSRVEVFIADTTAAGNGEGQTWLGALTTDASGNFSGSITGVSGVTAGTTRITGTATDTSSYTSEFGANFTVTGASVSGTVFEDLNYGGGAGRSLATGGGTGLANARVELYDQNGAFVSATNTDAGGAYTFANVGGGAYTVRVVNASVVSSRSGASAGQVGVMTYRTEAASGTATAVTDQVGGLDPASADAAAGAGGTALWTLCAAEGATCSFSGTRIVRYGAYASGSSHWTTRVLTGGTACTNGVFGDPYPGVSKSCQVFNATFQSVANVAVGSAAVTGIDFGFNFSTIVNTNDSGQGSLRQFITNANALGGKAALAQAGNRRSLSNTSEALPAATETSIFMIPRGVAVGGLRAAVPSQLTSGVAPIVLASNLPQITAGNVSLDGSTQTANVGDSNAGLLGTGGTVGTDALVLSQVARPEVELTFASLASGVSIAANNVTVRGLALRSTGGSALSGGAVGLGNDTTGAVIEGNVIGTRATGLVDPGAGQYLAIGVNSNGADSGTVRNNLITYFTTTGVQLSGTLSAAWTISGNEIRDGGLDFDNADGIALTSTTGVTISGNRVSGMSTQAIVFGSGAGTGTQIVNNTLTGNGVGPSNAATGQSNVLVARSGATGVRVEANVITANHGAGVAINSGATGIALTRNLVHGNGTIASRNGTAATGQIDIDLNSASDDNNLGTAPFVTANDTGDADSGGNNLQNHPVLSSAVISGGTQLIVSGTLNTNANGHYRIEFFGNTSPHSTGRGGAQSYLGFVNVASDGSGNASFSTTLTATVAMGSHVTATATKTDATYTTLTDTSEFAPNVQAGLSLQGTVFEDLNYGGGAGRSRAASGGVGLDGARVELYDSAGAFVSATTTAGGGAYRFDVPAAGTYLLRVVSGSVPSSRAGYAPGLVGVLTFRGDGTSGTVLPVTDFVGGTQPALVDPGNGSSGTVMNTSTHVFSAGLSGTAQAVAPIAVSGASVAGVDFGFNFNTVVNVNDSGAGSLRQALTNAEALGDDSALAVAGRTAAVEHVVFMIGNGTAGGGLRSGINLFSSGVATVPLATGLPVLASPLVIDAQTQPGWTALPVVQLNGSAVGGATSGLTVNGAGSVVRGLVINGFGGHGIHSTAGAGLVIQGNHVGTDAAGTAAVANTGSGIHIASSAGGHAIGGTTAAQRNVLSGNGTDGLSIVGGSGSTVRGNHVGLNAAGTATLANAGVGIRLQGSTSNTAVGGTGAGMGNRVAGNAGAGVQVMAGSTGNPILGNSIHANAGPGIDLNGDGISANDGAKTGGQGNLLMDSPVFTSARARGTQLTLAGHIGTAAGQSVFGGSRVEVYISDATSANGSGRDYLGALTADASGNFSGTVTMPYNALRAGSVLTGTATDTSNNTSEFGANFSGLVVDWLINHNGDGVDATPGDGLCETSTPGQCTLRAAIMETNAWAGADLAVFDLPNCPGAGCVITPASAMPAITGQLTLDGQTQPGWTLAPLVDLRGEGAGAGSDGLTVNSAGSIVRGLAVGGFLQSGIRINASNVTIEGNYIGIQPDGSSARANGAYNSMNGGVYIAGGTGIVVGGTTATTRNVLSGNGGAGLWANAGTATVIGNYVGTNAAGSTALGNGRWGVHLEGGSGHRIGGPAVGEGNVISGNVGDSIGGLFMRGTSQVVQGNTIGLNAARNAALPNGDGSTSFATGIDARSGSGHLIGGTGAGEGNVIAGNQGHGVRVTAQSTRVLGNAIYNNLWLGIDLGADGVTANNGTQSGALPNNDMDHPVITSAGYDPLTRALTLTGYVGTGTGQALFAGARIELFTSDGDATGYGEGSAFVGTLTADANGRFSGTVSVPLSVSFAVGTALTGTATDTANNTSEFGPNHVTTTMGALAPSRFNAFETSTAAGALTGVIQTRVAGVAGSIAIIAIDNTGTALQTSFAGTVTLEWMNATDNSGALDADNCRASWVAAGSAGSAAFIAGDLGRHNSSITPATVGREWRLRISYAGPGGTVSSCSTDAFAVRPDLLAITGVTDATDSTAGTTRVLDNLAASGGRVHRAGRPFSLRAAARDAASAVATGYTGTPTLAITGCVLPAGCTAGTLTVPSLVASAGLVAADTLSYGEVGAINVQLTDDTFADVDAADTPLLQRRIQSTVVGVGRFVPDRYLLAAANAPQFATQQGVCAAAGQGFTFVGQNFGWATAPSFTVTAQNAAGATTALWGGTLQKLSTAHVARSLAAANAQGLTPAVSWGTMTLTDAGNGVASVALGGDQFLFPRDAGAPVASFDPLITLGLAVSDVSEVAVSGNTAVAGTAALVIGSGSGIAFNQGSRFHYGRLKLQNAFGDVRRGVRANVELQKFTDRGWLRLSEDSNCITVPQPAIAFSAGTGTFAADLCTAPASAAVALRQGRGTLVLPRTAGNIQGAALVTLNIGATLEGNACTAGTPVTPVSAALPHLLGARGTGTTQDQNPAARLVWGRQHRDYMVQRELF